MEKSAGSGFACMECGHKFRSVAAAKRAAFGPNGCPKCGGSDIEFGRVPAPSVCAAVRANYSGLFRKHDPENPWR